MSDEIFNFIETQLKQTGITYWACRPCTTYAQGMNHRMKQMEEEMLEIKRACEKNESGLQRVSDSVIRLEQRLERQEQGAGGKATADHGSLYEELRERELRKTNVVMHGMKEAPEGFKGKERWDWDMKSCWNLFRALKLDLKEDGIKFVRRIGEAGEQPRPLVVGFFEESVKNRVLRSDTRNTAFYDVEIGPDMTKKQRQEEANLRAEAVKRNQQMGEEDRAKNLAWQVIGRRGEKRLEKRFIDMERERSSRGRQMPRGGVQRGRATAQRGRGARTPVVPMPGCLTGANNTALGSGVGGVGSRAMPWEEEEEEDMEEEDGVEEEEEQEELTQPNSQQEPVRGRGRGRPALSHQTGLRSRLNSKRKERVDVEGGEEEEDLPAAKH